MFINCYLAISSLIFICLIGYILNKRGIFFETKHMIRLFMILVLVGVFASLNFSRFTDLMFFYFNIPFIICISLIDIRYRYIYDEELLSMFICQLGIALFDIYQLLPFYDAVFNRIWTYLVSVVAYYIIGEIIFKLTGAIGEGDILFFPIIGLSSGLGKLYFIFIISFLLASLYSLPIVIKNKSLHGKLAFIPFISMSYIINSVILK